MATAIEFDHVGKQYRLGLISSKTLSHDLNRWWQMTVRGKEDPYLKIGETNDRTTSGDSEYVWALRDIDFKVEQGNVVGIIGKNGAGKSTLLKLLSKVTGPTIGEIRARGRIGALLEVGTGFHPEMTGRENIYMNGAIMGMTKNDVTRKLDEIIAFSGCERYIDTPVKRYSSGMTVRLGFAVAAHLEPEILVVDEVLAVGDAEFQKKAIGKMQDVSRGEGRTVLFVSHNMSSIKLLCNHAFLLDRGMVVDSGNASEVVNRYLDSDRLSNQNSKVSLKVISKRLSISEFLVNDKDEGTIKVSPQRNTIVFNVAGCVDGNMKIALEARLFDLNHNLLGVYSPCHISGYTPDYSGQFRFQWELSLPNNMNKGQYLLSVSLSHPNVEYLAHLVSPIVVDSEGIIGESGLSFDYAGSGFLML